jgi:glutathionylspermidine synthase
MRRISCKPRADWQSKIESLGLTFNNVPVDDKIVPYWIDDAVYFFSFSMIEEIKTATAELHNVCLNFVDQACRHDELLASLRIPESYWSYIKSSWSDHAPSLYGRFDLRVDPTGIEPPKMYEYNADTPTILIESSLVQANWLDEQCENIPNVDQWNDIHDLLVQRWKKIKDELGADKEILYLSCVPAHDEDMRTTEYLADTAEEAGTNCFTIISFSLFGL